MGIFRRQDLLGLRALLGEESELENHVQLHDAVVVEVAEVGLLVFTRHQALQVGAGQGGRHHLGETVVGDPHGADFSIGPRLLTQPLLGVIAVAGLVHVGNPFPAGVVAPPGIHQGDGVASLGEVLGVFVLETRAEISQQHESRKLAGRIGTIDVGGQVDAVPHRDRHFALVDDLVNRVAMDRLDRSQETSRPKEGGVDMGIVAPANSFQASVSNPCFAAFRGWYSCAKHRPKVSLMRNSG